MEGGRWMREGGPGGVEGDPGVGVLLFLIQQAVCLFFKG